MGDTGYVYAVARIRVKEKNLLSDSDIGMMTGMKDEKEIMDYLAGKGWGDGDPGSMDRDEFLACEEEKDLQLIKELKVPDSIFSVLSYPKRFHNLKAVIKDLCTEEAPGGLTYPLEGFEEDRLKGIISERRFKELPEYMQKVAEEAYDSLLETGDGQRCDIMIDKACLEAMRDAGKASGSRLLERYEEETVAVTDIKIAFRALRAGKDREFLEEALAECSSFDRDALINAASSGEESMMEFLYGNGYGEGADAIKESPFAFEKWCDDRVIDSLRPQKTNSLSEGPVIAYYLARENEIKTVRMILTAKANGFSEESIRERMRKMYG